METWPLQDIPIMIDRVTQHRPRLYGKMDMTSGFFQAAIDERTRPFTAFITSTGLFQWCRLPMGLKGAASYFQRMMADFALPAKQKQLKSFLGLINYFRDHVQGLSHKVKPLNEISIPYKKGASID
jgi:hypothetical protein